MSGRGGAPSLEQIRRNKDSKSDAKPPQTPGALEEEDEPKHHGGSFRIYMQNKNAKLQEQFEELGDRQQASNLFAGVSIHVNGYTVPSQQELKRLMALHGGGFQIYPTRSNITHIICSNLPDAKVKHYERERNPTPVVRPEWIVDSLNAGEVLPIQPYVLWQLRDAPGQKTLLGFRKPEARALPPSAIYGAAIDRSAGEVPFSNRHQDHANLQGALDLPSLAERARAEPLEAASVQHGEPAGDQGSQRHHDQQQQQQHGQQFEEQHVQQHNQQQSPASPCPPPGQGLLPAFIEAPAPSHLVQGLPQEQGTLPPPLIRQPLTLHDKQNELLARGHAAAGTAAIDEMEEAQRLAARMRAECDLLRGAPKSTKDDPNFMESFYKSSRLHFIGTWKARLESLMATVAVDSPRPTPPGPMARQRAILHIDMDCFFASVAEASNSLFKGKPLAVCHSASAKGTGEVSSANYEARKYGVSASMFIARAKELCPQLIVVPYEFDKYEEACEQVYRVLLKYSSCVQPISCDEAFVDVTGLGDPQEIAAKMRGDIEAATGCTASAGIGPNLLLARLATKRAKPNGQFFVGPKEARSFLAAQAVSALPGVGYQTAHKLKDAGLELVSDIQGQSKDTLQQLLGNKSGALLWEFAQGRDSREVEPPKARKSVGAEVNWGIRFTDDEEAAKFVDGLAGEVHQRLSAAGVRGRTITLKVKRRKEGYGQPSKFLGCGVCDNLSRSVTLARFTDSSEELARCARDMLRALRVPPEDIRGVGLAVSRLDNDTASAAAKPNAPAPAKLVARPPSRFDPDAPHPWAAFWQQQDPKQRPGSRPVSPEQGGRLQPQGKQQQEQGQQQQQQLCQAAPGRHTRLAPDVQPVFAGPRGALLGAPGLDTSVEPALAGRDDAADGGSMGWEEGSQAGEGSGGTHPSQVDEQQGQRVVRRSLKEDSRLVREVVNPGDALTERDSPAGEGRRTPAVDQLQQAAAQVGAAAAAAATPAALAAVAAGVVVKASEEEHLRTAEQHRRLLARYEGTTLTQIDAAELEGLPYSVQRQLIATLPRTSAEALARQQKQRQQQQLGGSDRHGDAPSSSDPEHEASMPVASPRVAQLRSAAGAAAEAAAGEAASSPGNPDAEERGGGPAAGHPPRSPPWGQPGSGVDSPIQALPSFSQLDPSVLDALPLGLKRELERAYGISKPLRSPPGHKPKRGRPAQAASYPRPVPKRQRLESFLSHANPPPALFQQPVQPPGQGSGKAARALQEHSIQAAPAAANRGAAAVPAPAVPGPSAARAVVTAAAAASGKAAVPSTAAAAAAAAPSSLSQVDPEVLDELPADVRREILAQLTPGGLQRWRKRHRSGGGAPAPSRLGLPGSDRAATGTAIPTRALSGEGEEGYQQGQVVGDLQRGQQCSWHEGFGPARQHQLESLPEAMQRWLGALSDQNPRQFPPTACQLGPALEASLRGLEQQQGLLQGGPGQPQESGSPASCSSASQHDACSGGVGDGSASQGGGVDNGGAAASREVLSLASVGGASPDARAATHLAADAPAAAAGATATAAPVAVAAAERLQAINALSEGLVEGCSWLVAGRLDELRGCLQAVLLQGRRRAWFAKHAEAVVRSVQGMVQQEHGWELRLDSWLDGG
ncbi:hypothetical protein N2152v2_007890 [Parachlorella kessleri]